MALGFDATSVSTPDKAIIKPSTVPIKPKTVKELERRLAHVKKPINLSIIGCVVNGPGEAAQTEIGLTGGGQDSNLLYLSGIPHTKVPSSKIIDKVVELVEEKIKNKN